MKIYTPQTACRHITEQAAIKYFRLVDESGNPVLPWNASKAKDYNKKKHVAELQNILNSSAVPDGRYFIQWRVSPMGTVQNIEVHKGKVDQPGAAPAPAVKPSLSESVRSFDEALQDKTRIKELELENDSLRQQLAAMMEAPELEEAPPANPVTDTVLSLLKEVGLPMLDRYFTLKEQEVQALSARATAAQTPIVAPAPSGTATTSRPVAVRQPTIVPQQNQPQPQPPVQVVMPGGAAAPEQQPDPEEQQLILFIQEATPEELFNWYNDLKSTEDAYTISLVRRYIREYRTDADQIL